MHIDLQRVRFVLVDDNHYMRKIIRSLLHGYGAREVYEASDGAEGLESFISYSPDIVITDWEMPFLDGLELIKMLRTPERSSNPYVPILMLTAHTERRRVKIARDAGVTEFLAKPISAKTLYQRIVSVITHPRPFIRTDTFFGPDRRRNTNKNYSGPERRKSGPAEVIVREPLIDKFR